MKVSNLILGSLTALSLALASAASAQSDMSHDAIAERLAPVGELCRAGEDCGTAAMASSSGGASQSSGASGEEIYGQVCMACHDTGAAGAPMKGDAEAWAPRLEKGLETLYSHAINGFNAMPAKGGNPALSDDEVKRSVQHLVEPVFDGELPAIGGSETASAGGEGGETSGEAAMATASDIDGGAIYGQVCMACHDTGAAGAPMKGDAEAWTTRLEKGTETLYDHAINGFNAMPAKGGNPALSDDEVKAAVDHLIATAQ
ncbi:c-type cytochrome [Halomonas sp. YLGW01]|uniref:c-type cytochrome n=1 Tax=Halomonas sp. YLGW01 TaxID=2773308 RepID=UPI001F5C0A7B|nr:c-type cytochrome [Halomonas sp. YLGW01]